MGINLVLGGKSEEDLLRPWKFIDIVLAFWRFYIDNLWGCVKSGGNVKQNGEKTPKTPLRHPKTLRNHTQNATKLATTPTPHT